MSYGKIYISEFTSTDNQNYLIEIYKKDYTGGFVNLVCAAAPVTHKWATDEIKTPVKGSSLTVVLLNENGSLPLSTFFSVSDNTFLVKFYWGNNLRFIGYLVQEDSDEIQVDFTHEITLTFTDNLGLLRDISLLDAARLWGERTEYSSTDVLITRAASYTFYIQLDASAFPAAVGDSIDVLVTDPNGVPYNGTYLITQVAYSPSGTVTYLQVAQFISLPFGFSLDFPGTVTLVKPFDLSQRVPMAKILRLCVLSTFIELNCNVYANIIENGRSTSRFLDETVVSGEYFLSGQVWQSCYQVLEYLLGRFKACLFQADGVWNLIRWDESRDYNKNIPGFEYDKDFVYTNKTLILSNEFTVGLYENGAKTYAESAPGLTIIAPNKYNKETFNYKQPVNLLRNFNLQDLGPLITSYVSGSNTIYEYEVLGWTTGFTWTLGGGGLLFATADKFIRVTTDTTTGNEISRIYVVSGSAFPDANTAGGTSMPIEVNANDKIKYSFAVKTSTSQSGNINYYFDIVLVTQMPLTPEGVNNKYLNTDSSTIGKWVHTRGVLLNIPSGDNSDQWHTVSVESEAIPYDGLIYISLGQVSFSNEETHYKDFTFEYIPFINETTKIIGHTHTEIQSEQIKRNEDYEIFLDDSPRNSINGTLFLTSTTGPLRDRTLYWQRGANTESLRLGKIINFEQLFWRRIARSKLEGTFYGLVQPGTYRFVGEGSFRYNDVDPVPEFYVYFPDLPTGLLIPGVTFTISGTVSNDGTYTAGPYQTGPLPTPPLGVTISVPPGRDAETIVCTIAIEGVPMHLSLLTQMVNTYYTGLNFGWGMLSIDYRSNKATGTNWELFKDGELDSALREYYEFKYLYQTK